MNREPPLPPELWARTPPEVQVYIHALEARVVALEATVQRLEAVVQHLAATIQQLQEQVRQDSRTSSRPPSSDPPQAGSKRPHREPSGRRPGGQPGHEGQSRSLMCTEAVAVMLPVKPERCRRCQYPWCGEDPQPQRHQVTEIPPMKPVVTEYRLYRLVCQVCGEATRAEWPAGVAPGGFGPRVQAITARCTGAYHRSKRTTQRVLEELFGVSMGWGTVANLEPATGQALTTPVVETRA
jgi:transposase